MKITVEKSLLQALNSKFSKFEQKILDYFINRGRMKFRFRASYQTIANFIGCNEKTVRRAVNKFIDLRLIKKSRKHFMDICEFAINKLIYDFADYLRYKFNSLKKHYNLARKVYWLKNVRPLFNKSSNLLKKISFYLKSPIVDSDFGEKSIYRGLKINKGEKMEISPVKTYPLLDEINEKLKLTQHGRLKLIIFPEMVLSDFWNQLKRKGNIKNPVEWLIVSCNNHCLQSKIDLKDAWSLYFMALKRYNIKHTDPLQEKRKVTSLKSKSDIEAVVDLSSYRKHIDKTEAHSYWGQFIPQEYKK